MHGPSLQRRHLFPNDLTLNLIGCHKDYILFRAYQNDFINIYAVVKSVVVKKIYFFTFYKLGFNYLLVPYVHEMLLTIRKF